MTGRRKKRGRPVSGWLVLDKPVGLGSTEAVARVKSIYEAEKAGHAGTLDPLASGVLPIALGEATKTVPYVMEGAKLYRFTVAWGEERTTDDLEGAVVARSDRRPTADAIAAALPAYVGVIMQVPPRFSAIKIGGARAYDLAREGEMIEIAAREVEISRFTLLECPDPDHAVFEVECGKGTYVRALARDLGRDLGCHGHVSALRRVAVFPFDERAMVSLDTLERLREAVPADAAPADRLAELDALLLDTGAALEDLPRITVSDEAAGRIRLGNAVVVRGRDAPVEAEEVCAFARGRLVAIGAVEAGLFRPRRVFSTG
jgi:tRNA pseudouridine55 synthase